MANYNHSQLWRRLQELNVPPVDADDFDKWLRADQFVDLLYDNLGTDEIIVHAFHSHTFIHGVIIDENSLAELDSESLLHWRTNHDSPRATYSYDPNDLFIIERDTIWSSLPNSHTPPLVYLRSFDGSKRDDATYPEVLQEFIHVNEGHWLDSESAFCKYDESGDLEHVATVSTESNGNSYQGFVTVAREPLEQYLTATRSALVLIFDFILLRRGDFDRWPDEPEKTKYLEGGIAFRQKIDPAKASYTRGVQILKPSRDKNEIVKGLMNQFRRNTSGPYVEFTINDWRNGTITTVSTDPTSSTNYFQAAENSLPYETSPAFFNPEVLAKYKADREKYTVDDTGIRCRNAWSLKEYDLNDAGQVQVYICDLRDLPYSEQVYWKSFNEPPKAGLSQRVIDRDFKALIADEPRPLIRIRDIIARWDRSDPDWWTNRGGQLLTSTNAPISASRAEWGQEFMNLAQLVVEGFKTKAIRPLLDAQDINFETEERSISLIEKLLRANDELEENQRLSGLRTVQKIRSKVQGHAGGSEAEDLSNSALKDHGSYLAHYEHVCDVVAEELLLIEVALT